MTKSILHHAAAALSPPAAEKRLVTKSVHRFTLEDEYAWLKAANWQEVLKKPKTLPADIYQLLKDENDYADGVLKPLASLRRKLLKELRARILEDDSDVPLPYGPWQYYERHREGGQHALYCRSPRGGGAEEILFDGDVQSKGKKFFDLSNFVPSADHSMLAWCVDDKGSEMYSVTVRDLATGKDFADVVKNSDGTAVWTADSKAFYYVRNDDNHRTAQVFRHVVGTNPKTDKLIVEEPDPAWFVHINESQDGAFCIVSIRGHDASECHLIPLNDPDATARIVTPREPGLRYDCQSHGAQLYIRTNADGAEDFKIVRAPLKSPERAHWVDDVPYRDGRMIVTGTVFQDFIVRLEREDGLPRLIVRDAASGEEHAIQFDEDAYYIGLEDSLEFDTDILRFTYSSMTTPEEVYDYNMRTRERILRKRQEIPSGHTDSDYVTKRIYALSADGARIPVTLLYRKDLPRDKPAPLLLYGYGAYGYSMPASFSENRFSLVDRGFVYALAHIRGGTDKGWHWYTNGKLENKPNTFKDFIAAARHLISEGYTAPGKIIAHGGSAGGMLMGAVSNMAPEVFGGIIADVPFVDVLNTMLDDELPLTPPEWLEWGNPAETEEVFERIRSYSPYDNVCAQIYPPILALGGLTDPRVTYWEPAKWVARLRERMAGGGPILLKTNMSAGHGGASGRFDQLGEVAMQQAFALACVGLDGVKIV